MTKLAQILAIVLLVANPSLGQSTNNNEIVPGDNLVVEGIPKIPASLAETAGRYTRSRWATLSSWHPTKREMLISTQFGDTPQLHYVKFPGGARTQLTFLSDDIVGGSIQPRTGNCFVFRRDTDGDQFYQIYRYDFSTGNVALLTDGHSRNESPVWSNSGELLMYGSNRRNGKDMDLWVMNPVDPKSNKMLVRLDGGFWIPFDWSADDQKALVYQHISANKTNLWIIDVKTGNKTLLTPQEENENVAHWFGEFSKDGKGVYVTTDRDSEFQRLAYIDLATKHYSFLTNGIHADVDEFDLSPDGNTLAFVANEDGLGRLHLLDTRTRQEKAVPNLPVGVVYGIKWHPKGNELGFGFSSARYPDDIYSIDTQTNKLERWTFSESGGINTDEFKEADVIRWASFDGRKISGLLYRPPAKFSGKRPVMIYLHGGPSTQTRPAFGGRNNYFLNELGIALIYPNYRGSSGYGKTFLRLDDGFLRDDARKDIGALLDWIKSQPDLDPSRVLIYGESYGGFLALAVAVNYGDRIRAAYSVAGISNLVTYLHNSDAQVQELQRVEFGDERDPKMRDYLERIAPANNVQKIRVPLLIVHGLTDSLVPPNESQQIVNAVKKNGVPVWHLAAKDEGHGFVKERNRLFQFYASVLFVKEYLLK
jgi:dipeptidyl aminopeptidase/acylaminoacyl peptidase